jgi:hypothetical protein
VLTRKAQRASRRRSARAATTSTGLRGDRAQHAQDHNQVFKKPLWAGHILHRCDRASTRDACHRRLREQPKTARADSESRILATKLFLENFAFHAQVARHDAFFAGSQQS